MSAVHDRAVALAVQGFPVAEISADTGLTYDAIRAAMRRRGVAVTRQIQMHVRLRAEALPPRAAVDYLLGVVDALTAGDADHPTDARAPFTVMEGRLARRLFDASPNVVTREALMASLYFDRSADEVPMAKIIDVFVHRVRPKLPAGVTIEARFGVGYAMRLGPEVAA